MPNAIGAMVTQLMQSTKPSEIDRNAQIIAMSHTMSQYKTAQEMGLSRTQVYNILKAHRESQVGKQTNATTHH